ncbi:DEAD/DEAH box helicase [Mucilaginibacter sp. PAMB04274]|uniref:DEAD/DEAH box helicase n=1 Tax=Mucilaginibacter sp. PAMB04274 TaxID=3138568 RepID=UPI0031F71C27
MEPVQPHPHSFPVVYTIPNVTVSSLTEVVIARHGGSYDSLDTEITAEYLSIDHGIFKVQLRSDGFPVVDVLQQGEHLMLTCPCKQPKTQLCEHQAEVLRQLIYKEDYRLFFDERFRYDLQLKLAVDYGLQDEPDLDSYFDLRHSDSKTIIELKNAALYPVTPESLNIVKGLVLPQQPHAFYRTGELQDGTTRFLVLKQHKYYKHLMLELYDAPVTRDGKIKNPLSPVNALELIWDTNDPLELKFYTAISRFQNSVDGKVTASALNSLKAAIRNPLNLPSYIHQSAVSEKVTATALQQVSLSVIINNIELTVEQKGHFFEISGTLLIGDNTLKLTDLEIKFGYFVQLNNKLFLVKDLQMLGTINFFKRRAESLLIHQSKYSLFQAQILNKLEDGTKINYRYIKPANQSQLAEQGFTRDAEKIIYLSDFGQHVMIVPVMRYGEVEIAIRSQKQINAIDHKGKYFTVQRNEEAERNFTALLLKQHADFEEQLTDDLQYFYLHKKKFLNEDWFLNAFEDWYADGITIFGFNELSGNNLNPHKAKISVRVLSGINWFNTELKVYFGKRRAALKHLHKAIRNKTKFVQLDDGTMGVLPAEWVERFTQYFNTAEIGNDELLYTPKANFTSIAQLYDDAMLDEEVKAEIYNYQQKLNDFNEIQSVQVSPELQTTLRHYQHQGLNWLNFLDDFNFGGCLADDMGLGKTIQIIAFILLQRQKTKHNTNLLVVPTSLIFNWQAEVQKFAPSIRIHTVYGAGRVKSVEDFDGYELILTSYGTLLSDVNFLKEYYFNYIFLDESQNVKNPDSQRYKAVRLLKSRNKIAITGTPIENNTFDLYSQLSFASPGLLGSKQYFKEIYLTPIDQFQQSKRTKELQEKIRPFVLRRTKEQVANELPEKTEIVLHCEMQTEQRKIYDAYEKEFREFISATTQESLPKKSMYVLKGLTKLRQVCDSPLLLKGEKLPGNASAKIDVLMEQIQSKAPHHKILIFSQFVTMLNLIRVELQRHHIGHAFLSGNTRNREGVVNDFQENAETRVFLVSLKAGGTGLNLTAADYIYVVDPWWNPAIENQAIDRAYRIGQKKNVVAVRLICPNTVEEKMMQLQETKRELAGSIITDASGFRSLTRQDLLGIVTHA